MPIVVGGVYCPCLEQDYFGDPGWILDSQWRPYISQLRTEVLYEGHIELNIKEQGTRMKTVEISNAPHYTFSVGRV
ncbi:hypothetical protein EYZ11_007030 [Aspergillus tanneri]|uniref:Uncharacterized protein n=1 Tax=Aspergillus tanneri TaxID=1220188 RepID=A0A4S3JE12_9EURO|nr:hypothetical protein EYZ11_007030 [Aspergillus tanneri]